MFAGALLRSSVEGAACATNRKRGARIGMVVIAIVRRTRRSPAIAGCGTSRSAPTLAGCRRLSPSCWLLRGRGRNVAFTAASSVSLSIPGRSEVTPWLVCEMRIGRRLRSRELTLSAWCILIRFSPARWAPPAHYRSGRRMPTMSRDVPQRSFVRIDPVSIPFVARTPVTILRFPAPACAQTAPAEPATARRLSTPYFQTHQSWRAACVIAIKE